MRYGRKLLRGLFAQGGLPLIGARRRYVTSLVMAAALLGGGLLSHDTAVAQEEARARMASGDWHHISTPAYPIDREEFLPPLGKYVYDVSWQGIPAAEATVEVAKVGKSYQVTAEARTLSGIDLFYELRYRAQAMLSAATLRPAKSYVFHRENSRVKQAEIRFFKNGTIEAVKKSGDKDPETMVFNPRNGTLDPIAASFVARGVAWEEGKVFSFDTFNGRSRYIITLTCAGKVSRPTEEGMREAWVIVPTVENVVEREGKKKESKLREAKIFLSADKRREVLGIESSVFVGTVSVDLASFEPTPLSQRGAEFLVAQNQGATAFGSIVGGATLSE